MSARRYAVDYIYDQDRWKVIDSKEYYAVYIRSINGVEYGELYRYARPKAAGEYLFGGLPNFFAPKLKEFFREKGMTLKKVRRPKKELGPRKIMLWWH